MAQAEMTHGAQLAWARLQRISCHHARQMFAETYGVHQPRRIYPPEVINENVEILGRGDEEELKHRMLWYVTFYPQVFTDAMAA